MQIFNVQWKWNIPNALSLLRILLIPLFLVLYLLEQDRWAFGVLLLSGISDMLDGFIARKYNLITDCGKLLDPIADKLTQVAVVVALTTRYVELVPLAILCLVKEMCQAIGGVILLKKGAAVRGSKWFGKLSTIVFYACMLVLVLWREQLSENVKWSLVTAAGTCMLVAFIGYFQVFLSVRREESKKQGSHTAEVSEKG